LYWYLQYFAAIGHFVLIRLWVLICIQNSINFSINNQPKSNKKMIHNRIDFFIEFGTDIFGFGLRFGNVLVPMLPPKPQKKGGGRERGTRSLATTARQIRPGVPPDPQNSCPRIPWARKISPNGTP